MLKDRIRTSFNNASETYDDYCHVQRYACEQSIELLSQFGLSYSVVGDFACGTGVSTECLVKHVKHQSCYGIDFAGNLLDIARNKVSLKKVKFLLSDFDSDIFNHQHFDLIFCNMGLQWSLSLAHTLKVLNRYLKKTGTLLFSIPLQGTFSQLRSQYVNHFSSCEDIHNILRERNLALINAKQVIYTEKFASQLDAIKSIKAVGANCLKFAKPKYPMNISDVFEYNNDATLTYHIGIFLVIKAVDSL